MNEPRCSHLSARQENPPHLRSSVRARRRGADAKNQTVKQILLRRRIVQRVEQSHSASTLRANAYTWRDSATLDRAAGHTGETSPRNQLPDQEEHEAKQKQP